MRRKGGKARRRENGRGDSGLTLLEVIVALMLFSLMATFLLGSQGAAADAALDAQVARDIAFLLPFRLNAVVIDPEEYDQDEMVGDFPATGISTRLVDEEELFGDRYQGFTWKVERKEVIGTGSGGTVSIDGDITELLFPEEANRAVNDEETTADGEASDNPNDYDEVDPDAVDMMLFIRVTVYPPGYDPHSTVEKKEGPGGPRSAWTAILIPKEEEEEGTE